MDFTNLDYHMLFTFFASDGQPFRNSFFWRGRGTGTSNSADLVLAFTDNVEPAIRAIVHESMVGVNYTVKNMGNPEDFTELTFPNIDGLRTGEYLPNFVGWTFKVARTTTLVRNGRKVFGRVSEADVANGEVFNPGVNPVGPLLTAVGTALTGPIQSSIPGDEYDLMIPKTDLFSSLGGKTYYKPIGVYNAGVTTFQRISTQSSRKNF